MKIKFRNDDDVVDDYDDDDDVISASTFYAYFPEQMRSLTI
jgi:hypothetical protein